MVGTEGVVVGGVVDALYCPFGSELPLYPLEWGYIRINGGVDNSTLSPYYVVLCRI